MAINIGVPGQETFNQGGFGDIGEMVRKGLDTYIKANEAQFAPDKIRADLALKQAEGDLYRQKTIGEQILNKYLPQKSQAEISNLFAEIANRKAQLPLYQAQAALERANIPLKELEAKKSKWLLDLLQQSMSGSNMAPQTQAQGPSSFIPSLMQGSASTTMPERPSSLSFGNNAGESTNPIDILAEQNPIAAQLLGLPGLKKEAKFYPETGQASTISQYPSGKNKIEISQIGRTPEEIAKAKHFAEADAKAYEAINSDIDGFAPQLDAINGLVDQINFNPEVKNVVGPFAHKGTRWNAGTKAQQDTAGILNTLSGEITLAAAKNLKGAFTGRDQGLINSLKPNTSDPYDVFVGKAKTLQNILQTGMNRSRYAAELIRSQGKSASEAYQIAQNKFPLPVSISRNMEFSSKEQAMKHLDSLSIEQLQALGK